MQNEFYDNLLTQMIEEAIDSNDQQIANNLCSLWNGDKWETIMEKFLKTPISSNWWGYGIKQLKHNFSNYVKE